jgi:hypothetical protein
MHLTVVRNNLKVQGHHHVCRFKMALKNCSYKTCAHLYDLHTKFHILLVAQ